jgi:DnaJ-domain-containing protein 1
MPRRPPQPPSFDDLIDDLVDRAGDYLKDRMAEFLPQLPSEPHPRRVGGQSKAKKRAPGPRTGGQGGKSTPRPKTPHRTAYTVLGVDPGADLEIIRAAYFVLCKRLHPDKPENHGKGEKMKELNAAWQILKDPIKRREYDKGMGL